MYWNRVILLLLTTTLSTFIKAQEENLVHEQEELTITSVEKFCELKNGYDEDRVVLTFENKSADTLTVSWNLNLWFDGECLTCSHETDEYKMMIELQPYETLSGSCDQVPDKSLQFFAGFNDSNTTIETRLTKFELEQLTIQQKQH